MCARVCVCACVCVGASSFFGGSASTSASMQENTSVGDAADSSAVHTGTDST
jgi:hypothetical protein